MDVTDMRAAYDGELSDYRANFPESQYILDVTVQESQQLWRPAPVASRERRRWGSILAALGINWEKMR